MGDEFQEMADRLYENYLSGIHAEPMQIAPLGRLQIAIADALRELADRVRREERMECINVICHRCNNDEPMEFKRLGDTYIAKHGDFPCDAWKLHDLLRVSGKESE